jgi:hypothetical protein
MQNCNRWSMNVYSVTGYGLLAAVIMISYIDNLAFWPDHESETKVGLNAVSE